MLFLVTCFLLYDSRMLHVHRLVSNVALNVKWSQVEGHWDVEVGFCTLWVYGLVLTSCKTPGHTHKKQFLVSLFFLFNADCLSEK